MIIAISIAIGLLTAWVAYRVLFYDSNDFWRGCGKVMSRRPRRWIWQKNDPPPPPEYFEDEDWSSGLRFLLFVVLSVGSAWLVYHQLQKHFG